MVRRLIDRHGNEKGEGIFIQENGRHLEDHYLYGNCCTMVGAPAFYTADGSVFSAGPNNMVPMLHGKAVQ